MDLSPLFTEILRGFTNFGWANLVMIAQTRTEHSPGVGSPPLWVCRLLGGALVLATLYKANRAAHPLSPANSAWLLPGRPKTSPDLVRPVRGKV